MPSQDGTPLATDRVIYHPAGEGRIRELAAEVARLVCVEDIPYVEDEAGHRALDLAANELGHLLGLDEPEFKTIWRLEK